MAKKKEAKWVSRETGQYWRCIKNASLSTLLADERRSVVEIGGSAACANLLPNMAESDGALVENVMKSALAACAGVRRHQGLLAKQLEEALEPVNTRRMSAKTILHQRATA